MKQIWAGPELDPSFREPGRSTAIEPSVLDCGTLPPAADGAVAQTGCSTQRKVQFVGAELSARQPVADKVAFQLLDAVRRMLDALVVPMNHLAVAQGIPIGGDRPVHIPASSRISTNARIYVATENPRLLPRTGK